MQLELPQPGGSTSVTVEKALAARRSCREYSAESVSLQALSQLLWAAQGVTGQNGQKAAPSAGGQYPLRTYVIARMVSGLSAGLYRYDEESHSLALIPGESPAERLGDAVLEDQPWVGAAAVIIAVTANLNAAQEQFQAQPPRGQRGARYVYIETGAVAENVHLQATALGVGCVLVGGFDDVKVKKVLSLPQELEPTALLCIGAYT